MFQRCQHKQLKINFRWDWEQWSCVRSTPGRAHTG